MDRLIPLSKVARRLCVPERVAAEWSRTGRLPAPVLLPGGRRRWRVSQLAAWVERLPTTLSESPEEITPPVATDKPHPDLTGLAKEILDALQNAGGRWMSGEELCRVIGDHADYTSGTWRRAMKQLRDASLVDLPAPCYVIRNESEPCMSRNEKPARNAGTSDYLTLTEAAAMYRRNSECIRIWIVRGARVRNRTHPVKLQADWVGGRWLTKQVWLDAFVAATTASRVSVRPDQWAAERDAAAEVLGGRS